MAATCPPLFDGSCEGEGWYFWAQREGNRDIRDHFEELWRRWNPYCSEHKHFRKEIRTSFNQSTWEIRVGCAVMDAGHHLVRPARGAAPDVQTAGIPRVSVEARATDEGAGPDAARRILQGGHVYTVDFKKIVLRLTGAISDKVTARARYVDGGAMTEGEPYVIAINAGDIPEAGEEADEIPLIVYAVFGYGEPILRVSVSLGDEVVEEPRVEWKSDPVIVKLNKSDVGTQGFLDNSYPCVSAILFSATCAPNATVIMEGRGGEPWTDLVVVHNPTATSPLQEAGSPSGASTGSNTADSARMIIAGHVLWLERRS